MTCILRNVEKAGREMIGIAASKSFNGQVDVIVFGGSETWLFGLSDSKQIRYWSKFYNRTLKRQGCKPIVFQPGCKHLIMMVLTRIFQ